jgi:16S rRNA (guanine527-N7)-methyltransferase
MGEDEAKELLKKDLKFSEADIDNLEIFRNLLLDYNSRYNLISKSTETVIWSRHILDSAQLVKYFNINLKANLVDFGSGAGFPGLVLAIFNKNPQFHVKLYEKSPVKREFLNKVKKEINLNVEISENVFNEKIDADIIVVRAFKKLDQILNISRETVKKPHKILILKGKNAQAEINNVSLAPNYSYKLEKSVTDIDSKIIVIKVS